MSNIQSLVRTLGVYIVIPLSVFGTSAVFGLRAWAAGSVTVPNTFSSGQLVSSAQMNDNFQALVTAINSINNGSVPSGTVIAYAGSTLPPGWLLCDGSAVNRTEYANLFTAIGINHGGGDGINTFNLPDYRGRFLRGVDANSAHDPDSASRTGLQPSNTAGPGNLGDQVGSYQASAFASHTHSVTDPGHAHGPVDASYFVTDYPTAAAGDLAQVAGGAGGKGYAGATSTATGFTNITLGASGGSTETRPANVYVQFVIKI
jgi:microcystin-dependent protein